MLPTVRVDLPTSRQIIQSRTPRRRSTAACISGFWILLGSAVAMALACSHSGVFSSTGAGLRVPTLPGNNLCLPVFYAVFMVSNLNPFNDNHREGAGS